jgi:hypothetical protein
MPCGPVIDSTDHFDGEMSGWSPVVVVSAK